jgi:transposase
LVDASCGDQQRHRLSRAGNRRINRALHIMAIVQLRHDTDGRRYDDRRVAEGKTPLEAMRALKRRLSDVVYRSLVNDQKRQRDSGSPDDGATPGTGPGGHVGAATRSSAAGSNPNAGASDKSLPEPVGPDATPASISGRGRSSSRSRRPSTAPARSRRQAASA